MSKVKLIPIDDGECPFPFFEEPYEETIAIPSEAWYNIYNDGNHFVGVPVTHSNKKHRGGAKKKDDIDICFDSLYLSAVRKGLKDTKREKQLTDFILSGMKDLYENYPLLDEYVSERIERKRRNLNVRKKRFRRKAYLNKWNYFITVTYFYGHSFIYHPIYRLSSTFVAQRKAKVNGKKLLRKTFKY